MAYSQSLVRMDNRELVSNIICVGNPGTGKSTLLNSMLEKVDPQKRCGRFKSGVSIGEGLTYKLDTITVGNTCFMDTPGLADVTKRKEAAEAIHQALKKGGKFQVLIVVTLEAGRVKPEDAVTAKLVLESAPDITEFGIVFNKITEGVKRRLNQEAVKKLMVQTQPQGMRAIGYPLILMRMAELDDIDDVCVPIPELEEFQRELPYMTIIPKNVYEIHYENFERILNVMEKQLEELRNDNKKMEVKIREMEASMSPDKMGFLSKCLVKLGKWLNSKGL